MRTACLFHIYLFYTEKCILLKGFRKCLLAMPKEKMFKSLKLFSFMPTLMNLWSI